MPVCRRGLIQINMASRWPVEESDYNESSTASVNIDTLLDEKQTSLNPGPYLSQQCTGNKLLGDEHLEGESSSLTDVFQSSMADSEDIDYCPDLKQAPSSQEQTNQSKDQTCNSILGESRHKEFLEGRKSIRKRVQKRAYSPEIGASQTNKLGSVSKKTNRKKKHPRTAIFVNLDRPYDTLPNGTQFRCDLCKCPYVFNPLLKKLSKLRKSKQVVASPRYKIDPVTKKKLTLCNACGLSFDRPRKIKKTSIQPSEEEKKKYFEESQAFASVLAVKMNNPTADKLWCPNFKSRPCGCLQEHLSANGDQEEMIERAQKLLEIMKKAKELSSQKCYNINEVPETGKNRKRFRNIGLGNGQKRSKAFEEFVMLNRSHLRKELQLCERATQRILNYSNNFLHKKLKTEERECRVTRVKGKAALGLLPDLNQLCNMRCCGDMCVMIVLTHFKLLNKWRERAISGQMEARRVLAEMLTPTGGVRSNCYKFISWVTGCSHSTIGRVNEQMQKTGGDREPPVHGLKKYWKDNSRAKMKQKNSEDTHDVDGQLHDEVDGNEPVESCKPQQEPLPSPSTTQQQQNIILGTEPKVVNSNNSNTTTVTNVPVETLNQLLMERQFLQQQLIQQTILQQQQQQQIYQQESAQNSATVQQLLLKLLETNHVNQNNNNLNSEASPVYTNCFLRTQHLISPSGSQVLTSTTEANAPTMVVSLDQSAVAQKPRGSASGNSCQQSNKAQTTQQVQGPQSQISVPSMSSFLSSIPLTLPHNVPNQSQLNYPLSTSNKVSSVPILTAKKAESVNCTLTGPGLMPLTQTSLGLLQKSVSLYSKPNSDPTPQTVSSTMKVNTRPIQTSPATKTVEMVSVNIPVIPSNATGLTNNWTNVSVHLPQNVQSLPVNQQQKNATQNILPFNVFQRLVNISGIISTNESSANIPMTLSVPTTNNKYIIKKSISPGDNLVTRQLLPLNLDTDQHILASSLTTENYNGLSAPFLKLTTSSSKPLTEQSHSSSACVTETSTLSEHNNTVPIQSTLSKEVTTKGRNVLIAGDNRRQYPNCDSTSVMFQTEGDVELLQLVPLSVAQSRTDENSEQPGAITTLPN